MTGIALAPVLAHPAIPDAAFAASSAQPRNEFGVRVPASIAAIVSSRGICFAPILLKPAFNLFIAHWTVLTVLLFCCSTFFSSASVMGFSLLFVIVLNI
jgi:hypothetical protein